MITNDTLRAVIMVGVIPLAVLVLNGCATTGTRVVEENKFIQLHHVANTDDALHLKPGDAIAMACAKCKTVLYASVEKPRTKFFTPLEHRHYCPGCKSTITFTGAGFGMKQAVKHSCGACGSDSVFCCATQLGSGPTTGMDTDKK
jgi:ribosomal protein L33